MSESLKRLGLDKLDLEQRLALIEEIWNSIDADESAAVQLLDARRAELQARLLEEEENPEDFVCWVEIRRFGRGGDC